MAGKEKLKVIAEGLFVEQGMNCKDISNTIDVSEKTLVDWRNKGEWDRKREETLAAPNKIRELLLKDLKTVAEGGKSLIDADSLAKISKVLESLSNKLSPQIAIYVIQALDNWMAEQSPKMAIESLPYHKRFIQHIIHLHAE